MKYETITLHISKKPLTIHLINGKEVSKRVIDELRKLNLISGYKAPNEVITAPSA